MVEMGRENEEGPVVAALVGLENRLAEELEEL